MKEVWNEQFPDDLLERIHTVNFMESEFDEPSPVELFHVHIYFIPRSKLLGKVIREHLQEISEKQYVAWHDYKIFQRIKNQEASDLIEENVPWDELQKYIKLQGDEGKLEWEKKIKMFMNQLQRQL